MLDTIYQTILLKQLFNTMTRYIISWNVAKCSDQLLRSQIRYIKKGKKWLEGVSTFIRLKT